MLLVQKLVGQIHIVMGVKACDTAVMESSIARSADGSGMFKESVAVTECDADPFLYLALVMPEMSADTLAPIFLQSAGAVKSIGAVSVKAIGLPLGRNICGGNFCPGDSRTSSFLPYLHHLMAASSSTVMRYLWPGTSFKFVTRQAPLNL
jgi:hypothetical protein